MKKLLIVLGILLVIVFACVSYFVGARNNFVILEEGVNEKWAQVENVYQRRLDLIPNLVNTVKGYASHERETLTAVTQARSNVSKITPEAIQGVLNNPQAFQQFQQAQTGLSQALSRLMLVVERYPDLKANQNFLNLQSQLEGTENRIAVERKRFNEAAKQYNTAIRLWPKSMIASLFGFERKAFFEADRGAEKAPTVSF